MTDSGQGVPALYQHSRRPVWGYAILAEDLVDRRKFQFQDGKSRTFKLGYYELMEEMDIPVDKALQIVEQLIGQLQLNIDRRKLVEDKGKKLITVEDQCMVLAKLYSDGFDGEDWNDHFRGGDSGSLKRHRNNVIRLAVDTLSDESLSRDAAEAWPQVIALFEATDITSGKSCAPLRAVEDQAGALGALRNLIHGEDQLAKRVDAWVGVLGPVEKITWPLASAPLALAKPQEYTPVRPSAFRKQAQWMAPRLKYDKTPNGDHYERYVEMAEAVRKRLTTAGYEPADMLDVYDFIVVTLKPSSLALLK